ncbi:MAG: bifunctional riboflavin kinase/FAD synthetase [Armatimonadota bacterium]|nr:bifunctional riboflavin kinase/FAD synthetase [Armatimonadota bacterium]MDR7518200.1 bifunctional riboflavin kinase/FAD synthetase [Armatimonadota bacterium]MDR7548454.1 bifunctional riboflavin kinase/FAD synthetase [Armatimonadota bacterium]
MIIVEGLDAYRPGGRPVCLALGTFDGVHLGHRAVIQTACEAAGQEGGDAVVLTFDPHPLTIIAPPEAPFLLTTLEERVALLAALGVDVLVVVRFTEAVRQVRAADWLDLLARRIGPRRFVLSSTHAFGRDREGTPAFLEAWAAQRHIGVTVVPPVTNAGTIISSTAIRDRLREGDVRTAGEWLGRWYSVRGTVVPGEGRGRRLGVPTANLLVPADKVVPARGVYAAYATARGQTYRAAVNVGLRPTFGEERLTVEAHLLDADVDLYGESLELAFVERLRDECRFDSVDALRAQVASDVARTRGLLELDARLAK